VNCRKFRKLRFMRNMSASGQSQFRSCFFEQVNMSMFTRRQNAMSLIGDVNTVSTQHFTVDQ
jgi:hypothetical protein